MSTVDRCVIDDVDSGSVIQETQSELDATRTQVKRQSSDLELSAVDKERLLGKLKAAEGNCLFSLITIHTLL